MDMIVANTRSYEVPQVTGNAFVTTGPVTKLLIATSRFCHPGKVAVAVSRALSLC